jgi:tetratricopeptide (TPR) repeat protein
MRKAESLFIWTSLLAVIIVASGGIWRLVHPTPPGNNYTFPDGKFGGFLAAQHAVYVNDFDMAAKLSNDFSDRDLPIVKNTIILANFLDGKMPDDARFLQNEPTPAAGLIYDAWLLKQDDWKSVYNRHKRDDSPMTAPLRIWSSVAMSKTADALKFLDTLKTNSSWKSFVRGQIYAETGKPADAAKQFADVDVGFMNINDYIYINAFYKHNKMDDAAAKLRADFTARPGGMYMLNIGADTDWTALSGNRNALAFSLIQNVSHTQILMYSDLSLLLLRLAESVGTDGIAKSDAINYYLGQYFFNNGGDYKKYFDNIIPTSPYYPFARMKIAEKTGEGRELERAVAANPLFVPAANKLIARHVQNDNRRGALRVVNESLDSDNLTEIGRAFFLKTRAAIYMTFGDMSRAQTDIRAAADILPVDSGIIAIQARIWATQKRELDTAYEYAMALVRKNPADIEAWDTLGMVVAAREGAPAALDLIERVGHVSETCSVLFEHLGDLYMQVGNKKLARDAYLRAIDLSDDGLTILPVLHKKLGNIR